MSLLWNVSLLTSWVVLFLFTSFFFFSSSRFTTLLRTAFNLFKASFPPLIAVLFFTLLVRFLFIALTANVPLFVAPTIFYRYVLFIALLFWVPIIRYAFYKTPKSFVSHILPYGAPLGLMLFLPLVEIFSQVIRPLTLTIRFATNLSAGHIMIYMFSYFSLLSSALSPFLYVVLRVLLIIEIFIVFLQVYIFVTLLGLYLTETL